MHLEVILDKGLDHLFDAGIGGEAERRGARSLEHLRPAGNDLLDLRIGLPMNAGVGGIAAGEAAYARIRWQLDLQIQEIISSWPQVLQATRAEALGFAADTGIDEVVQAFIEDDLKMQKLLV